MPDTVLDIRFAHYLEDSVDDEGFLQATHQAGLQVEKKKALKQAQEQPRGASSVGSDRREDGRKKEKPKQGKGEMKPETQEQETRQQRAWEWWGGKNHWGSKEDALKGVPAKEQEEYGLSREDCWRGGRPGYRTFECFSFNTRRGTTLPLAPWKVAAVGTKRPREEEENPAPAKQQKIVAVKTMDTDADTPLWEDCETDF